MCQCKPANRHRDCTSCGTSYWARRARTLGQVKVCGVCHQDGKPGHIIRGSEKRTCARHKAIREKNAERMLHEALRTVADYRERIDIPQDMP